MKSRSTSVRRARPSLGTIVEIRAGGAPVAALEAGIDAAFAAVDQVHRLMSFHEPSSDISRINCARAGDVVPVHAWTRRVLRRAREIFEATAGLFDCSVARVLCRAGYLPSLPGARLADARATLRDLELQTCAVRLRHTLSITLDGIAKGFAVDEAVQALKRTGIASGAVNAGGDLRVFGGRPEPMFVRHPGNPGQLVSIGVLRDAALATSALYFSRGRSARRSVSPIIDPSTGQHCGSPDSVSISASDCMTADALTKVVLLDPHGSAATLQRFNARAVVILARPAP